MPRVLVIEHETGAGLGRLAPAEGGAVQIDVWRPYLGQPAPIDPHALDGYDGLVVLGGTMGAHDDHVAEWLPLTRQVLAAAVGNELPTLGICLGAQLLAAATEGVVERGRPGLEVGLVEIQPTPAALDDPVFSELAAAHPGGHSAVEYHYDAVIELPPGAVLLETSSVYPNQAYRLGRWAWAVQYHPEVSLSDFVGWVTGDAEGLAAEGRDVGELVEDVTARDGDLQKDADTLWQAWYRQVLAKLATRTA